MHKMHLEDTLHSDDLKQYDGDKQRSINSSVCKTGHKKEKRKGGTHPERTGVPADHIKHVPDDGRHMNQGASSKGCS